MNKRIFKVSECESCKTKDKCNDPYSRKNITKQGILIACKSFYYVYSRLEETFRLPIYQGDTERYDSEYDSYVQRTMELPCLDFPKIANGALAVELAMKFLTFCGKDSFIKTHNLEQLFNDIPDIYKTEIMKRIKEQTSQNDETFTKNLHTFANAFDQFRYFFGHEAVGSNHIFDQFVKIVCEYVLEFEESAD